MIVNLRPIYAICDRRPWDQSESHDVKVKGDASELARAKPTIQTAIRRLLTEIQSNRARSALMLRGIRKPTWPSTLKTSSSDRRKVKRENKVVSGLWKLIMEVISCSLVLGMQLAFISWVSVILAKAVCCPICRSVQTLKTTKWNERLGPNIASNAFSDPLPMLLWVKSVEAFFFLASCVALLSKQRWLVSFPTRRVLGKRYHTNAHTVERAFRWEP